MLPRVGGWEEEEGKNIGGIVRDIRKGRAGGIEVDAGGKDKEGRKEGEG